MKKEKLPNALTSEKDLSAPRLIKNPKERKDRDALDIEADQFFRGFEEDINDLKKMDVTLKILLRHKIIDPNETTALARNKINERIKELEETVEALNNRGFARNEQVEFDDVDNEFEKLMDEDSDQIKTELEYLKTAYRVSGYMLRAEKVNEADPFLEVVKALSAQIKMFTF